MALSAKTNSGTYDLAELRDIPKIQDYHWNEDTRNDSFSTWLNKLVAHLQTTGGYCIFKNCIPAAASPTRVAQWVHGIYFIQSSKDDGTIWLDVNGVDLYFGLVKRTGITWRKVASTPV